MARLLVVSRSMALALRLADAHEVSEHPADDVEKLVPDPGIDVMVLDVGEPAVATGVLERLRARGSTTPVLVVSGYQPEWADLMTMEREDVVVVPLPITRAALLDGIERLSSSGTARDASAAPAPGAAPVGLGGEGPTVALADRATSGERQRLPDGSPGARPSPFPTAPAGRPRPDAFPEGQRQVPGQSRQGPDLPFPAARPPQGPGDPQAPGTPQDPGGPQEAGPQGPGAPGALAGPPTPDVLRLESLLGGSASGRLLPDRATGAPGQVPESRSGPPGDESPFPATGAAGAAGAAGPQPTPWPGAFVPHDRGGQPAAPFPGQERDEQDRDQDSEQHGHRFLPWRRSRKDGQEPDGGTGAPAPAQGPSAGPAEPRHARNGTAGVTPLPVRPLPVRPLSADRGPSDEGPGGEGASPTARPAPITASLARPRAPHGQGGEDFDWWAPSPEEILAANERQDAPARPRQDAPQAPVQEVPERAAPTIPPAEAPTVVLPLLVEGAGGGFVPATGLRPDGPQTPGPEPAEVSGGAGSAEVAGSSDATQPAGIPVPDPFAPAARQVVSPDPADGREGPDPTGPDGFTGATVPEPDGHPGQAPDAAGDDMSGQWPGAGTAGTARGSDAFVERRDDDSPVPSVLLPSFPGPTAPGGAQPAHGPVRDATPDAAPEASESIPLPVRSPSPFGSPVPAGPGSQEPAASPEPADGPAPPAPPVPEDQDVDRPLPRRRVPQPEQAAFGGGPPPSSQDPGPPSRHAGDADPFQPVFIDTRPASTRGQGPVESDGPTGLTPRRAGAPGLSSWSFGSPSPSAASEPSLFEPAHHPSEPEPVRNGEPEPGEPEPAWAHAHGGQDREHAHGGQDRTDGDREPGTGPDPTGPAQAGPDVPAEDPAIAIARRKALHERVGHFGAEGLEPVPAPARAPQPQAPQQQDGRDRAGGGGPSAEAVTEAIPLPVPVETAQAPQPAGEPVPVHGAQEPGARTAADDSPAVPVPGPEHEAGTEHEAGQEHEAGAVPGPLPGHGTAPEPGPPGGPFGRPEELPAGPAGLAAGPAGPGPEDSPSPAGDGSPHHGAHRHEAERDGTGAETAEERLPLLVRELLGHVPDLFGVRDAAQVLAEELRDRARAEAVAVLVPDNGTWRVDGGVGLRPAERRMPLEAGHWLVAEAVTQARPVLLADTDHLRRRLADAPLSSWHRLMAVSLPAVQALALLARGHDASAFDESDVQTVSAAIEEATSLFRTAVDVRELARRLSTFQDGLGNG